jgi:hypothetical protein
LVVKKLFFFSPINRIVENANGNYFKPAQNGYCRIAQFMIQSTTSNADAHEKVVKVKMINRSDAPIHVVT